MLSPDILEQPSSGRQLMQYLNGTASPMSLHNVMLAQTLGANYAAASDEELETAFHQWNESVIASLPPDRILVFDPSEGWGPLCTFLGVPLPRIPSPHVSRRMDMHAVLQNQLERGRLFHRFISLAAQFFTMFTISFE